MRITNFSIYTSESKVKNSKEVIRSMLSGAINGRYLSYRLFIKEIRAEYSQSKFGVLWDFLEPIVLAIIFMVLRKGNVINAGEIHIPYAVFVVYGLLLWQTFTDALMMPLNVMQRSKTLLTQVKIPPEALIGSVILKVIFNSLFRITALIALSLFMNAFSIIGFIKFAVLFPAIILVGLSFGLFLAPFNVIYNDIRTIIRISIRPLLYASPILYAIPPVGFLVYFNKINIVGIVLSNLRMIATQNLFYDFQSFGISYTLTIAIFLAGWFIFHLSIPILSDKL